MEHTVYEGSEPVSEGPHIGFSEKKGPRTIDTSRVTSMVLHDVRSPLFYLDKIIFQLYKGAGDEMPDTSREQLKELYLSVKTVTGHIQNLFAWINMVQEDLVIRKTRVELFKVLEAVTANYQLLAAQQNSVIVFHCERNMSLLTQPELLQVILRNLVDNAIKNTSNGLISIRAEMTDMRMVLTVEDSGNGMGPKKMEQLLSPGSAHDSAGMGYMYIHDILEMLNITMEIQSTPGKGTAVFIYFPL